MESYCSSFYKIINISTRTNPVIVLSETCPNHPYYGAGECNRIDSPFALGNYLYLMKYSNYQGRGIQIFDVTNRANPVKVGSYLNDRMALSLQVKGNYIYATNLSGGGYLYQTYDQIKVIDITDKTKPIEVNSYTLSDSSWAGIEGIYSMGDYLYLSSQACENVNNQAYPSNYSDYPISYPECHSRISLVDITNMEHPSELGSFNLPAQEDVLSISDGYIYTTNSETGGLHIYELRPKPLANVSVLNAQTITATVSGDLPTGTYDLYVTNPDGKQAELHQAFSLTEDIPLSVGLNLFGYPLEPPTGYTSYDLIGDLGTENEVNKIQRYNPDTKNYETTTYSNGAPRGNEFTIINGEGYLVYLKIDKSISLAGTGLALNPPISGSQGLNLISIPDPPSWYNSYDLLSYLESSGEITAIRRFNREKGIFETTNYCFGKPSGVKFNLIKGEAYLIYMKTVK